MKQIQILLVEDDPGDVRLIQEAFRNSHISYNLRVVSDGIEALETLGRKRLSRNDALPKLILLDLNLPGKDGKQVLHEVKSDKNLWHIPIIVFSTSDNEDDIKASYALHANCYITKPEDFDKYEEAIQIIEKFWLTLAQLP